MHALDSIAETTRRPVADFASRLETLRAINLPAIMEWIADRFADAPRIDDSIDWEDGEVHDEPHGPPTL